MRSINFKRIFPKILIAIVIFFALAYGMHCIGTAYRTPNYEPETIISAYSPDGHHRLKIMQTGPSQWSFGPTPCLITLYDSSNEICSMEFDLMNDGSHARADNFSLKWHSDHAEIIIDADESPARRYFFYFDGKIE